jgi:hypothetical protein
LSAIETAAVAAAAGVRLAPAEAAAVIAAAAEAALPKGKKKASRINWDAGVLLRRITQATEDLKDKKGEHFKEGMALKEFSIAARIPRETFQKHAQGKRALGKFIGRPGHLDGGECLFVVDLVRRRDRARDGLCSGEVSPMAQKHNPSLSAKSSQVKLILSPMQRAKPKTSARKTGSSMPHCVARWVWLLRVLRSGGE